MKNIEVLNIIAENKPVEGYSLGNIEFILRLFKEDGKVTIYSILGVVEFELSKIIHFLPDYIIIPKLIIRINNYGYKNLWECYVYCEENQFTLKIGSSLEWIRLLTFLEIM